MEKIYMEESKNRKSVIDGSVVLSFVVAAFAIFSLVAVGFNQISYAAVPHSPTEDTFTFYATGEKISVSVDGTPVNYNVPLYYSDSGKKNTIFCVEHNADVLDQTVYTKKEKIDDYGLLYLLNKAYDSTSHISGIDNTVADTYVAQTAIWYYLHQKYQNDSKHKLSDEVLNVIKSTGVISLTYLDVANDNSSEPIVLPNAFSKIDSLVKEALNASSERQLSVAFGGDSISKVDGTDYYQTPVVNVTSSTSEALTGYDISVSGIEGTKVVGEDGQEITNLTNVSKDTKFYIRIPADKVTDKVQKLAVDVKGHFNSFGGAYYQDAAGAKQKVVSVTGKIVDVSQGDSIDVVGAPDTGMTTAQTIYFIGLIVLLCGVGIVYANAKPAESK